MIGVKKKTTTCVILMQSMEVIFYITALCISSRGTDGTELMCCTLFFLTHSNVNPLT